jgi:hypothetical protein
MAARQIDLLCGPQLMDADRPAPAHSGGIARGHASGLRSRSVTGWRMAAVAA